MAAEEARAALNAASLSVSRWERESGVLRTIINVGALGPGEDRYPDEEIYLLGEDRAGDRLLRDGVAYFNAVDDTGVDPWNAARLRRLGKESEVGVPIMVEGDAWGEVYATTAPGQPRFRGEDVRFLEAVAGQLAVAIGRAELFSRVSRLAYEDSLTGLANRRAVEERLERAVSRAGEREGTLAVLLCDVDELKAINDESGHDAGDRALRRVGDALVAAAAARPGSLVGRLAGDEFCVIMEGGSLDDARELASAALATLSGAGKSPLMISCGAAALGGGVAAPAELLRAADAALYRAKRNGGGQIFTAGSRAPDPAPQVERRALRRSAARTPARRRAGPDRALRERPGRREGARANRSGGNGARGSDERRRLGRVVHPGRRRHDPHGVPGRRARPSTRGTAPEGRQRRLPGRRLPRHRTADGGRSRHVRRASRRRGSGPRGARHPRQGGATCGADRGGGRPRRHLAPRDICRRAERGARGGPP